ncbi:hypothetical protein AYI68_g5148 [Smittium mucronatum]|uniref:Uncharacterized protein n=1 Tax=Smittium mucronatum TaxID=133383 RepID=A0A1R0GV43_9FUNG|nr:hypothetical protein AYI68_g5148 [Smittium mucronatum]
MEGIVVAKWIPVKEKQVERVMKGLEAIVEKLLRAARSAEEDEAFLNLILPLINTITKSCSKYKYGYFPKINDEPLSESPPKSNPHEISIEHPLNTSDKDVPNPLIHSEEFIAKNESLQNSESVDEITPLGNPDSIKINPLKSISPSPLSSSSSDKLEELTASIKSRSMELENITESSNVIQEASYFETIENDSPTVESSILVDKVDHVPTAYDLEDSNINIDLGSVDHIEEIVEYNHSRMALFGILPSKNTLIYAALLCFELNKHETLGALEHAYNLVKYFINEFSSHQLNYCIGLGIFSLKFRLSHLWNFLE